MGPVLLLFAVSLLHSCEAEGSSSATPVFVQTGKDLFLHVMKPVALEEGGSLTWKLNGSKNIVRQSYGDKTITFRIYKGRADFVQNYSLLLKNVKKNESGVYTAQVSGDHDQYVAEYKVTVQDPVSSVKLTVNSSSSDSCNCTVTCSTPDSHISSTFRCDTKTCSQEEGEKSKSKTYPSSITVYLEEGFIICNHSNHVSWTQDKEMESVCGSSQVPSGAIAIGIGTSVCIAVLAVLIGLFIKYKKKINGNAICEVPQNTTAQTLIQNPTEDASGSSSNSTYCLVRFPIGPEESTKTRTNSLPETVYAQVNRSAKTKCRSPPP